RKRAPHEQRADTASGQIDACEHGQSKRAGAQGADGVPHTDEVGRGVGDVGATRVIFGAEGPRARLAFFAVGIAPDGAPVWVDLLARLAGNAPRRCGIALQTLRLARPRAGLRSRHAAMLYDARHAAHRIGATAEAEQVDAVARLPHAHDL